MRKENKANIKILVASYYIVKNTERHIIFVGFVRIVNEQNI